MLRVKISLVYLVMVGLLVGLVILVLHVSVGDALKDDAEGRTLLRAPMARVAADIVHPSPIA